MDFGIDGCYSHRAAEIRNKVWKLRVEWNEVTVMVFGFVGCYVQRIAMTRKQFFFHKIVTGGKYTNNKNRFLCSYSWRTDIDINFNILYSVWIEGKKYTNFATCVLFFWGTDFVVGSATGGKTIQHFIMATCSLISEEPTSHYNTEINPKPLTFHFSTWYHHDTYVFGHMTLGG